MQESIIQYNNSNYKDIIIGSILNYAPKDVACWINSINHSGFSGDIIVLNFGCPQETIDFLQSNGAKVYDVELNGLHIVVQRFISMFTILHILDSAQYRAIFATDVKDVIFQKNPSLRFNQQYNNPFIIAATENIQYANEDWGNNNLRTCFPHLYEFMKWQIIYCAGVIAGEFELMRDLFLHIYHLSLVGLGGDPQPDQAAYNILLNTTPFKQHAFFADEDTAWAANLGTTLDPNKMNKYMPYWIDPAPIVKGDRVLNHKGEEYYIVHQYDRVPELKSILVNKFGNIN